MTFVRHRYRLGEGSDDRLGFVPAVISADVLYAVSRADDLMRAARERSDALVQSMRDAAEAELSARVQVAEEAVWSRSVQLSDAFAQWRGEFTEHIGKGLASVVRAYLDTLTLEMPDEAKTLAALGQLIHQVGPVLDARLLVPVNTLETVQAMALPGGWVAESSERLLSGECRLVLSHGEWSVSFDGMLQHFLGALGVIDSAAGEASDNSSGTG